MALDRELFDDTWAMWCSLLAGGKEKTESDSKVFYAIVKHLTDDQFREASKTILRSQTFFPPPATVLDSIPNRVSPSSDEDRKPLTKCTDQELAEQREFLKAELRKCKDMLAGNKYMKYAIKRINEGLQAIGEEEAKRAAGV